MNSESVENDGEVTRPTPFIITFASIPWSTPLWERQQELALGLSMAWPSIYVEPLGLINHGLAGFFSRVAALIRRVLTSRSGTEACTGPKVLQPIVLPYHGPSAVTSLNARLVWWQLRRKIPQMSSYQPFVWISYPSEIALEVFTEYLRGRGAKMIYDCSQRRRAIQGIPARVIQTEEEIVCESDSVIVDCSLLAQDFASAEPKLHIIPQGVDAELFSSSRPPKSTNQSEAGIPVVGYLGSLHRHVDYDLLCAIADERPQWSLVLLGPVIDHNARIEDLLGKPNVRWLGSHAHRDLPRYVEQFCVGMIPYAVNDFTKAVWPTKLLEYFASGIPVVSSRLPEVAQFDEFALLADSVEDWIDKIEYWLANPPTHSELLAVARRNDWDSRVAEVLEIIRGLEGQSSA